MFKKIVVSEVYVELSFSVWKIMKNVLFLLIASFAFASEVPNFRDYTKCNGVVFLLTTQKSGSNLVSSCLSAVTRRPISWIRWGDSVLKPFSTRKDHPSYNRLGLPLVSNKPLLYRTHYELDILKQVPSICNQLIFLTRNPKELLFRDFRLTHPENIEPDFSFIETFLIKYLAPFKVYESWDVSNKMLVFYEDFIFNENEIILDVLHFIKVKPICFEDFINNKEKYLKCSLESYEKQHEWNKGGLSSLDGPKAIFYTEYVSVEILRLIDEYLAKTEPDIWEHYLKRFATYLEDSFSK
jgi:hypothetical protein